MIEDWWGLSKNISIYNHVFD